MGWRCGQFELVGLVKGSASFDEERKKDDAGAEYARNEGRPGRSPLGFCKSPNPVHEGRFATNQNEVERNVGHAALF
jgi:hypothetical protein